MSSFVPSHVSLFIVKPRLDQLSFQSFEEVGAEDSHCTSGELCLEDTSPGFHPLM